LNGVSNFITFLTIQLEGMLDAPRARAIYESGYTSVYLVAKAKPVAIMKAL
jgi:hypothetical protein